MDEHTLRAELAAIEAEAIGWLPLGAPEPGAAAGGSGGGAGGCFRPITDVRGFQPTTGMQGEWS